MGALAASERAGVRQSGVHRYAMQLIGALPALVAPDELIVYSRPSFLEEATHSVKHVRPAIALENPAVRALWEQAVLPAHIRLDRIDLYHGLAFVLPRLASVPMIVTIHDLAFMRWPDQTPSRRSAYLKRQVKIAVDRATRVIAVSEHTRKEVIAVLGVSPERIDVTPLGVEKNFRRLPLAEREQFMAQYGLLNPFILAVGNLEPRKILVALVRAFEQ
ncbi:MAG: glycosyltransferase, partial [Thermomicrobiales bacterium]